MILKFRCGQFPNAEISGVRFINGVAEVDSIYTETLNELLANPFVEAVTPLNGLQASYMTEEVSYQTFKNRLNRKSKVELLKIAEDFKLPIGDKSIPNAMVIEMILKAKYPQE